MSMFNSNHASNSRTPSWEKADVSRCETWLFDLDNTLYPASVDFFSQMDRKMKAFIAKALDLTPEEAFQIQKCYYHEYGTTLRGLMVRHALEPEEFLEYVHAVDHSILKPDPALDAALAALPGRKMVFTNGPEKHAIAVLERLGVERHFTAIFDIHAADYIPKPSPEPYRCLVQRHHVRPERAVMVEDTLKNLPPAAALGITTVWLRPPPPACAERSLDTDGRCCHYAIDHLPSWLATVGAGTHIGAL
ncbi:MAG: putative hydrolase of the HAD superfamily [Rhodospirillaceae bacterium]|nr:MAG: putative hydrolase of the HAD superfamily [Rhodospirillaceae bacterium]